MSTFRNLTVEEVTTLTSQNCFSDEWDKVQVHSEFNTNFLRDVTFSGIVRLGKFGKKFNTSSGIPKHSGIYRAHIHNSEIGNDSYIHNVTSGIANYKIENNVFIENVNIITVKEETTFGNGVLVPVMNEQGGRAVPMFNKLTAQIAYLLAFYRHREDLMQKFDKMINNEVNAVKSDTGIIKEFTTIINTESIINTFIGSHCIIEGAKRIKNASIHSSKVAPITIGNGVYVDSVIMHGNSSILDGAIVDTCFLAEGCDISKQFSAENSLFFSNFIGHHGEAFAIFAGPHTATHHKSTLLISAYLSFLNAGSGSNQSNHMYKLGPLHQGVIDRGSKTGSNSYVLWPAHIGAFTLILGRHMNHPDISELPYSYLIEEHGDSLLLPGVNIKSVGTIRDADKWPFRDKRSSSKDIINYDLLSPYSVGKIKRGQEVLQNLLDETRHNERRCYYNGVTIPLDSVEKGIAYYQMGLVKYVGNQLAKRLLKRSFTNINELRNCISTSSNFGNKEWIDLSGLVAPKESIEDLISQLVNDPDITFSKVQNYFNEIHNNYHEYSWNWCSIQIEKFIGKKINQFEIADIEFLLGNWITTTEKLNESFLNDADKEFGSRNKISFGLEGNEVAKDADFLAVRGSKENNNFMNKIYDHSIKKNQIYQEVLKKLKLIK